MAGIAFDIRKLLGNQDISSTLAAFFYSGIVSSGPWLFTVFSLGIISSIGKNIAGLELITLFMGIIIYVFSFSTVFTYGSQMVITRYLADRIYYHEDNRIPSLLITTLLILGGFCGLIATPFIWKLDLEFLTKLEVLYLFILVSCLWGTMIYVSTLKAYIQVTSAFVMGFSVAIPLSLLIGRYYGLTGFLFGLNCGITLIVFSLTSIIFKEFNGPVGFDAGLFKAHSQFPVLLFFGIFSGLGIWCDKFIFWFFHKVPIGSGLIGYPTYDGAMFIGYLTALPALAYFILIAETDLYDNIRKYNFLILSHSNYRALKESRQQLTTCLKSSFFNIGIFQGLFTILCILVAPVIIDVLGMNILQVSILRIGILGAFFQVMTMLLVIVLTYIKGEKECLVTALLFFILNAILTLTTVNHFWLYGYGYFGASFISFLICLVLCALKVKNFHYNLICKPVSDNL